MFTRNKPTFSRHFSQCDGKLVPQGLAVTPAKMAQLAERGVAVSVPNSAVTLQDGVPNPVLDITQMRGVDISDAWNAEQDAKKKLVGAHIKDKEYYG